MTAQMTSRLVTLGTLVLACCLVGCSSSDDSISSPVYTQPATGSPVTPSDDAPRDDLTEERYVTWEHAEVIDDTSIRVTFWAGTHRCFGSRYVVQETDTQVAIAIVEGKFPKAPAACTEEARQASLVVETLRPIGERDIVVLPESALDP